VKVTVDRCELKRDVDELKESCWRRRRSGAHTGCGRAAFHSGSAHLKRPAQACEGRMVLIIEANFKRSIVVAHHIPNFLRWCRRRSWR